LAWSLVTGLSNSLGGVFWQTAVSSVDGSKPAAAGDYNFLGKRGGILSGFDGGFMRAIKLKEFAVILADLQSQPRTLRWYILTPSGWTRLHQLFIVHP